ncbi:MAG: phosphatidate cytidylyltransferase [Anaerolineaceae bacterium]|nr:MAG: phosphatidate cytidylyltransferase [Anaerolineaceae bacterium]
MLIKRTLAALVLAVIGIPAIIFGGIYFFALITLLLGIAAWEFGRIFRASGFNASDPLLVGGVVLLATVRAYYPDLAPAALALLILAAMTWHLVAYERGRDLAATDFTVTLGGLVYLGWIGAYLIELRNLPDGLWWLLLALPSVWLADTAAYFVGVRFGKHRLSPRLSPKKTWEGYWGGVFFGALGAAGLAVLWRSLGGPAVTWWQGAALGAALSILTTLGDLGESMLKRQAGVKDSSHIIPGHGGVLDRIDSWLWGGVLGYFFIIWFLL